MERESERRSRVEKGQMEWWDRDQERAFRTTMTSVTKLEQHWPAGNDREKEEATEERH